MKKILSLALLVALCFSLSSCGEVTMQTVIDDARDFISDVDSVHCATMTGMDLSEGEENVTSLLNMDADLDFKNKNHHMYMATDSNGEQMALEIYVSTGEKIDYYLGANDKWVKMSNLDESLLGGVSFGSDLNRDFEAYFAELESNSLTEMTVEEMEGEEYYKFYAPVTIDSLAKAKDFGIDSFITGFLGKDASKSVVDAAIEALGKIDVTVYINCDTYEPYGFVMDLAPALVELYKNVGITNITVTEAYSSSVYTDYDDCEVEIPENVLNAPDSSTIITNQNAQ